jgi:hypothetical protein
LQILPAALFEQDTAEARSRRAVEIHLHLLSLHALEIFVFFSARVFQSTAPASRPAGWHAGRRFGVGSPRARPMRSPRIRPCARGVGRGPQGRHDCAGLVVGCRGEKFGAVARAAGVADQVLRGVWGGWAGLRRAVLGPAGRPAGVAGDPSPEHRPRRARRGPRA